MKEPENISEQLKIVCNALIMMDACEASECAFDNELYDKALEIADEIVNGEEELERK